MSISTEARSSQLLVGDGSTKTYAFAFKVFDSSTDITIYEATGEASEKMMSSDLYTVTLNEDQENYPGGSVTFTNAPAADLKFRIVSSIPYLQKTHLMNLGSFSPKTLNEVFDKLCALIQQVRLLADRALVVPYTQDKTPEEVLTEVLEIASTANDYAQQALEIYNSISEVIPAIMAEGDKQEQRLVTEGDKQEQRLVGEGDAQVNRIKAETDNALIANGTGCAEKFWTLSADTPAGTDIVIPSGLKYLVNRHHLRVSWNGLVLAIGQNFTEDGAEDTFSDTFRLTFDAKAGDEIDIWIGAIGAGDMSQALALAGEASAAVADLSRKVVYKESSQPL